MGVIIYTLGIVNLALGMRGTTCVSSSEKSSTYNCIKAIDGVESGAGWRSYNQGTGAWIKLEFFTSVFLYRIRVLQGLNKDASFKDIKMTFSDGTTVTVSILVIHIILKTCDHV